MRRLFLVLALSVGTGVAAAPATGQVPPVGPPTLSGEQLLASDDFNAGGGPGSATGTVEVFAVQCDVDGESRFSYRAEGLAIGPYPGSFEETGTVVIGPQTVPPGGVIPRGEVTDAEIRFEIMSAVGRVTGTKTLSSEPYPLIPNNPAVGSCLEGDFPGMISPGLLDCPRLSRIVTADAPLDYEATIHTAEGSFSDAGRSFVGVGVSDDSAGAVCTYGFFEEFLSSRATTTPLGPDAVLVTPKAAFNPVRTQHEVTATVTNAAGGPVSQVHVRFDIAGASGEVEKSCVTQEDGQCSITYTGPTFPGIDTITACADSNNNHERDPGEPCDEATKEWMLPVSTPGKATGGGQILHAASTGTTFGFTFDANHLVNGLKGECEVLDHAPATTKIDCLNVLAYVQTANEATVYGNATIDGEDHGLFRLRVVDNGESGIGQDVFEFETEQGYLRAGVLTEGDIQVHPLATP